jgi:membrane-associated PAP2 superfamily phosphatase
VLIRHRVVIDSAGERLTRTANASLRRFPTSRYVDRLNAPFQSLLFMLARGIDLQSTRGAFWWQHARLPLLLMLLLSIESFSMLDSWIAHQVFFDDIQGQWIGAHVWLIDRVLHTGGRWMIRGVAVASALLWVSTFAIARLRIIRRPTLYFFVALVLAIGIVGLLKKWTNIDCPWDLQEFGGRFPYVHLFARRAADLRRATCFPAAHASSGYALMCLYFVARERSRFLARIGIATGLGLGLVFGIAQQSRGAHFVSHDIWSACITWIVSLTIYVLIFRCRVWEASTHPLQGTT